MRVNTARNIDRPQTHEGAPAKRINPEQALRRSVLSCLLWEREFYEDGESIADRITTTAAQCEADVVARLAFEARHTHGLRHAPLLLLIDLIKRGGTGVAKAISGTIRRPDELTELVALYWLLNPGKGISAQMKRGLGEALTRFDEYQLAKYNRPGPVQLRDVLFLSHAKPKTDEQAALFKRLAEGKLAVPDTWEVELSRGEDKRVTFERLINEGKLGYMALLRNLRNMLDAGCNEELIREAILARKGAKLVLPFRYIAAANAAPAFVGPLGEAMLASLNELPELKGRTAILVDTSGSMRMPLSERSAMACCDAAAALASMVGSERVRLISFASSQEELPFHRGLAGAETIAHAVGRVGHDTNIGAAVKWVNAIIPHDRLIVITDEQSHDRVPDPNAKRAYMINVASYQNGVGYHGRWVHVDGFSESVIRYIAEIEAESERLNSEHE